MQNKSVAQSAPAAPVEAAGQILDLLRRQFPGRVALSRTETARACGWRNPITVDRLRQRGLLRPSVATRKPAYTLNEIARFLAETSSAE
jgi:hypothetical protein